MKLMVVDKKPTGVMVIKKKEKEKKVEDGEVQH